MIQTLFKPLTMKIAVGLQFLSLGAIILLLLAKAGEARRADMWQSRAREEATAHRLTVAEVERVRAAQKAKDAEHARQVEQAQSQVSQEVSHDYQVALADLRARYDRLRTIGAAATDSGGGGGANLPGLPDAAGGSDDAAGEEGFSHADRFLCSAQAWQLEALQQWVREQGRVSR